MSFSSLLSSEKQVMDKILTHSPVTAVVCDCNGKIAKIYNGELLSKLGYPWQSVVEGNDVHIFIPEEKREKHKEDFRRWMENPVDREINSGLELQALGADGESLVPVEIVLRKLELENGEGLGDAYAGRPFRGGIAFVLVKPTANDLIRRENFKSPPLSGKCPFSCD